MSSESAPLADAFPMLPLGSIKARGWLERQLRLQADGFTGRLGEVWPDVGPNSAWLGGTGEDWERGPYYCDGLVPLAHLLGDQRLLDLAQRWLDWSLASQTADGFFGPRTNDDWWPRMVMLKALTQHAEATGDPRIEPFLERYFAHQRSRLPARPLERWGRARGAENLRSVLWLYHRNGDSSLLRLAELLEEQTLDWGTFFGEFPIRSKYVEGFGHLTHVVNVAMGLKDPALRFQRSGGARHRAAVDDGLANLDRYHGMATGMFSGDEWLAGLDPSQGVELCAVVEMMFSLEILIGLLGDPRFGDRLERIAYNNLASTITADARARQYDQQPNQVLCTVAKRSWTQNQETSNIFGLEPNFGCCTANLHQGWPKLAASLWRSTPDGGFAAVAYGPSVARQRLGDVEVSVDEVTDYPFGDNLRFEIHPSQPVELTLALRIPEWRTDPDLLLNGQPATAPTRGGFVWIRRVWCPGDVLDLDLTPPIRAERRPSGGVAITRGPLVYALAVGEDWRRLPSRGESTAPFFDWEVYPSTPWNFAVNLDLDQPEGSLRLERGRLGELPFAAEPLAVRLRGRGRRVADWALVDNSAGPLPASPVTSDSVEEDLTLVPYGCARLRVAEMPYYRPEEDKTVETRVIVGQGPYRYTVDKNWGRGPKGVPEFGIVSSMATDSRDRVYVFNRAPNPRMIVLDSEGSLLGEWGQREFGHPHGVFITPGDDVYCTDRDTHQVTKWTTRGDLLRSWGRRGEPGAPGAPFNQPTKAVITSDGEMYVSDGYGQHRVHRFNRAGDLVTSWGAKGTGPGQFALPHDVWVDPRERVLVCDRENQRVQQFDRSGRYLGEWSNLRSPMAIFVQEDHIFLAEGGQRITIMTLDGSVVSQWGSRGPGEDQFTDSPHNLWVDSRGDIYVCEVLTPNKIQKFSRVR